LVTAALCAALGCSTVDVGAPPADINACRPDQRYFVETVWPGYLTANYGGKTCADANCHGPGTSSGLRLLPPTSVPSYPLLVGTDWYAAYLSAAQAMTCTDVNGSALYDKPAGLAPSHGGGTLFAPGGPEFTLLMQWVMPGP
jgi:hypothetical protein